MKAFEKVTAPFDGVITARNTDIGALIQAGNASGAKELFHLADNHILRVYFSVPEEYAAGIQSGETVSVTFDAFPREKFDGEPRSERLGARSPFAHPQRRGGCGEPIRDAFLWAGTPAFI